jgi:hypothetical protein
MPALRLPPLGSSLYGQDTQNVGAQQADTAGGYEPLKLRLPKLTWDSRRNLGPTKDPYNSQLENMRETVDQAFAKGLIDRDTFESAIEQSKDGSSPTWVQDLIFNQIPEMLGHEMTEPQRAFNSWFGGGIQTAFDVLSLGDYASAAFTAAASQNKDEIAGVRNPYGILGALGGAAVGGAAGRSVMGALYGAAVGGIGGTMLSPGFSSAAAVEAFRNRTMYVDLTQDVSDNQFANFALGMAFDIGADPVTYLTAGTASGVKLATAANRGLSRALMSAVGSGKATDKIAKVVEAGGTLTGNRAFRAHYQEAMRRLAPEMAADAEKLTRSGLDGADELTAQMWSDRAARMVVEEFDSINKAVRDNASGYSKLFSRAQGGLVRQGIGYSFKILEAANPGSHIGKMFKNLRAKTVTKIDDLFQETASPLLKDRGVYDSTLLRKRLSGLTTGAGLPVIGKSVFGERGMLGRTFDFFDRGWDSPPALVDAHRVAEANVAESYAKASQRYVATLGKLSDEQRTTVFNAIEARHASNVGHFVTPGAVSRYDDDVENAIEFVRSEFDSILLAERRGLGGTDETAGFAVNSVRDYISRVYQHNPKNRALALKYIDAAEGKGIDIGNRYTQQRMIAQLAEGLDLYGGEVLTDAYKILVARKRASLEMLHQEQLMRMAIQEFGIPGTVIRHMATGTADSLLRGWARKANNAFVHQVIDIDQSWVIPNGNLMELGFRKGDSAHNLALVKYLAMPQAERIKAVDSTGALLHDVYGFNEAARLHSFDLGSGAGIGPLPTSFKWSAHSIDGSTALPGGAKLDSEWSIVTLMDMMEDASHPAWRTLFSTAGEYTTDIAVSRAAALFEGANSYALKHFNTTLFGFLGRDYAIKAVENAYVNLAKQAKMGQPLVPGRMLGRVPARRIVASRGKVTVNRAGRRQMTASEAAAEAQRVADDYTKRLARALRDKAAGKTGKFVADPEKLKPKTPRKTVPTITKGSARKLQLGPRELKIADASRFASQVDDFDAALREQVQNAADKLIKAGTKGVKDGQIDISRVRPQLPQVVIDVANATKKAFGYIAHESPMFPDHIDNIVEIGGRLGFTNDMMNQLSMVLNGKRDWTKSTAEQADLILETFRSFDDKLTINRQAGVSTGSINQGISSAAPVFQQPLWKRVGHALLDIINPSEALARAGTRAERVRVRWESMTGKPFIDNVYERVTGEAADFGAADLARFSGQRLEAISLNLPKRIKGNYIPEDFDQKLGVPVRASGPGYTVPKDLSQKLDAATGRINELRERVERFTQTVADGTADPGTLAHTLHVAESVITDWGRVRAGQAIRRMWKDVRNTANPVGANELVEYATTLYMDTRFVGAFNLKQYATYGAGQQLARDNAEWMAKKAVDAIMSGTPGQRKAALAELRKLSEDAKGRLMAFGQRKDGAKMVPIWKDYLKDQKARVKAHRADIAELTKAAKQRSAVERQIRSDFKRQQSAVGGIDAKGKLNVTEESTAAAVYRQSWDEMYGSPKKTTDAGVPVGDARNPGLVENIRRVYGTLGDVYIDAHLKYERVAKEAADAYDALEAAKAGGRNADVPALTTAYEKAAGNFAGLKDTLERARKEIASAGGRYQIDRYESAWARLQEARKQLIDVTRIEEAGKAGIANLAGDIRTFDEKIDLLRTYGNDERALASLLKVISQDDIAKVADHMGIDINSPDDIYGIAIELAEQMTENIVRKVGQRDARVRLLKTIVDDALGSPPPAVAESINIRADYLDEASEMAGNAFLGAAKNDAYAGMLRPSTGEETFDVMLPSGVASFVQDVFQPRIPPHAGRFWKRILRGIDFMQGAYKTDLLFARPAYWGTNLISNSTMAALEVAKHAFNPMDGFKFLGEWTDVTRYMTMRNTDLHELFGMTAAQRDAELARLGAVTVDYAYGRAITIKELTDHIVARGVIRGYGSVDMVNQSFGSRAWNMFRGATLGGIPASIAGAGMQSSVNEATGTPGMGTFSLTTAAGMAAGAIIAGRKGSGVMPKGTAESLKAAKTLIGAGVGGVAGANAAVVDEFTGMDALDGNDAYAVMLGAATGALIGAKGKTQYGMANGRSLPMTALDQATNMVQTNWSPLIKAGEAVTDTPFRVAVYLAGLKETGTHHGATQKLFRTLHDWAGLSSGERNIMARIFPFWNWMKFAIERTMSDVVTRPGQLASTAALFQGWTRSEEYEASAKPGDLWAPSHLADKMAVLNNIEVEANPETGAKEIRAYAIGKFGLPLETALDTAIGLQKAAKGESSVGLFFLGRGTMGLSSLMEAGFNIDSFTGSEIQSEVKTTRMEQGAAWDDAPSWMKTLVGYKPATEGFAKSTVNPRMAWILSEIPNGNAIAFMQKIYDSDEENLNHRVLASEFLGLSVMRLDPKTGQYRRNKARIEALATVLKEIGVMKKGETWRRAVPGEKLPARKPRTRKKLQIELR